jgi:hypothetical protein
MMMQELLDQWAEIKNRIIAGETPTTASICKELNLLEALRLAGVTTIPGEIFDVEFLINDRNRLLSDMSGKGGMKRLVRNIKTGKFLMGGGWTDDKNEATSFNSLRDAVDACSRQNLKETQLVMSFGNGNLDITLPIS